MTTTQNTLSRIIDYECGLLDETETIELFQELIDTQLAWRLQGHYGRTAAALIESGLCRPSVSELPVTYNPWRVRVIDGVRVVRGWRGDEDSPCTTRWVVLPGHLSDEEALALARKAGITDACYEGPGRSYATEPWIYRAGSRLIVRQDEGVDI